MVRIPESAVTVGVPGVSAQPIREAVQIGGAAAGLTEASAEFASRLAEAERIEELNEMSAFLEGSLADLRLRIEQDPELNTVASADQAFEEGAESIRSELGESSSPIVNRAIQKQFSESSLQGSIAVRRSAYERQADASIAGLDAQTERFELNYAAETDDIGRALQRKNFQRAVNLNPFISEQDKGDRIRDYDTDVSTARFNTLVNAGAFEEAQRLLGTDELVGIDPVKNAALQKSLDIAERRAVRDLDRDLKRLNEEKAFQMLVRFEDQEDPNGVPTVGDILAAGMSVPLTQKFIKMAKDHANGVDINAVNDNIYNEVYIRIHDETRADRITNIMEVLPFLGNGLGVEELEKFRADLKQLETPEARVRDKLLTNFLTGAKGLIDRSTLLGKDGKGGKLFADFTREIILRWEKGLEEGKDPRNMTNEQHPDYIGGNLRTGLGGYIRTEQDMIEDMAAEARALSASIREGVQTTPTPTPAPVLRLEDESPEAYLERIGQ